MKIAAASADWARSAGMLCTFLTAMVSWPSPVHGVAAVDREIDQERFELRDVGDRITMRDRSMSTSDPDPTADPAGRMSCATAFDLGADIEYLRLQRLRRANASNWAGQLGRPLHVPGDRIRYSGDGALPANRGGAGSHRGADDGEQIVKFMRHAAGQLTHRLHFSATGAALPRLPAFGDIDGFPAPRRSRRQC